MLIQQGYMGDDESCVFLTLGLTPQDFEILLHGGRMIIDMSQLPDPSDKIYIHFGQSEEEIFDRQVMADQIAPDHKMVD